jgi:hypothetical protein
VALVIISADAPDHRKMLAAGPNACWLWLRCLAWCRRFPSSRGLIPKVSVSAIAAGCWSASRLRKLCEILVSVGLWHEDEYAYRVHEYEQYALEAQLQAEQPTETEDEGEYEAQMRSAEALSKVSSARSQAGKRGALSRWQNGKPDGKSHGKTDGKPDFAIDGKGALANSGSSSVEVSDGDEVSEGKPRLLSSSSTSKLLQDETETSCNAGARGANGSLVDGKRDGKSIEVDGKTIDVRAVWIAYSLAYRRRYGGEPIRNAKVNGQLAQFIRRVPSEWATATVTHYVGSPNARYVAARHDVGNLLRDAEKLCSEAQTGQRVTASAARREDKTADRGDQYGEMFARLDAEDRHG